MDFALLPPEVNSGRMYTGPGSAPLLAAAAAWDTLAAELHAMAAGYESAVAELAAGWRGPSAARMTAAAAPYTSWLHTTAAQAEQSAVQGRAAAAAYEAAFAATVPPPAITANRSLLAALVATNLLGQNTPAIAATEAHYAAMWAQDAVAMCGYAGAAAAAAQLTPFTDPPQTADSAALADHLTAAPRVAGRLAGTNVQNQLSKLTSLLPNTLQHDWAVPAAAASSVPGIHDGLQAISGTLGALFGPYSPLGQAGVAGSWFLTGSGVLSASQHVPGVASLLSAPKPITGILAPLTGQVLAAPSPAGLGGGAVAATASRAGLVGGLSVPPSWTATAPAAKTIAAVLPNAEAAGAAAAAAESPAGLFGGTAALSSLAGRAMDAAGARSTAAPRTIGTAAACVGSLATDGVDTTVTIVVIPPPER